MPTIITRGAGSAVGFGLFGTVAAATDPYFNYNTLLLPGNGTNGGQNNTFLDSSTNNFTITRNGNTTQGTFSPFSQTGWGVNTGSSGANCLQFASNAALQMGTGNFTIEGWFYPTGSGNERTWYIQGVNTTGGLALFVGTGGARFRANGQTDLTYSGTITGWSHVAFVRSGNTRTIYLNGVSVATDTLSFNNNDAESVEIGAPAKNALDVYRYYGDLSNVRVVKGTAVYTSNFTPSTSPLTAISGTSLLICQNNRFIDNSSNNFTPTISGSPSVQAFSPFAPTAAYSASTVGGSGYFDGSGDYLSYSGTTVGASAFTFECWFYITSFASVRVPFGVPTSASSGDISIQILSNQTTIQIDRALVSNIQFTVPTIAPNSWNHLAVVRDGSNNCTVFLNGTRSSSGAVTNTISYGSTATIGVNGPYGGDMLGYLSGARIVVGSAVYDPTLTTCTVPTSPPTNITNTKLLLNFTNAAIIDNTAKNVLETVGNAQISTTQSKFGGGSIYLDGNDNCVIRNSENFNFRNGNFTIEFWYYPSTLTVVNAHILDFGDGLTGGQNGWNVGFFGGSNTNMLGVIWTYDGTNENKIQDSAALTTGSWVFVTVVRSGTSLVLYKNGSSVASATLSGAIATSNRPLVIGSNQSLTSGYVNGYIDDLRITKGIARYTSNFTPPTAAFPLQ